MSFPRFVFRSALIFFISVAQQRNTEIKQFRYIKARWIHVYLMCHRFTLDSVSAQKGRRFSSLLSLVGTLPTTRIPSLRCIRPKRENKFRLWQTGGGEFAKILPGHDIKNCTYTCTGPSQQTARNPSLENKQATPHTQNRPAPESHAHHNTRSLHPNQARTFGGRGAKCACN